MIKEKDVLYLNKDLYIGDPIKDEHQNLVYLCTNPHIPSWLVINALTNEILSFCDGKKSVGEIVECIIQQKGYPETIKEDTLIVLQKLQELNVVNTMDTFLDNGIAPDQFKGLYLEITSKCNLKCRHCYLGDHYVNSELPLDKLISLIDECIALQGDTIMISGGEPFLHEDINSLLDYVCKKNCKVITLTNGTLIDDQFIRYLSKYKNLFVQISIDGMSDASHDFLRSQGMLKRTKNNIDKLISAGLCSKISLSYVINKLNRSEIPVLLEWCKQVNIKKVSFKNLTKAGTAIENWDLLCLSKEPQKVFDILSQEIEPIVTPYREYIEIDGIPSQRNFSLNKMINPELPCPFGSILRIDSRGDVYPCQMFNDADFIIGNVYKNTIFDISNGDLLQRLKEIGGKRMNTISQCRKCTFKHFCGGGCMALAYAEYKNVYSPEPLCQLRHTCLTDCLKKSLRRN